MKTRVLIADDHEVVRKCLGLVLIGLDDLELAGEASDGEQAVAMYDKVKPDVVLMDMVMPSMDGVTAIQKIRERHPQAKIIVLTAFDSDDLARRALHAGALGYLNKDVTADELLQAIRGAQSSGHCGDKGR